jgi:hypothetical protein
MIHPENLPHLTNAVAWSLALTFIVLLLAIAIAALIERALAR